MTLQWVLASLNGSRNRNNAVEQCQVTIDRCESFIEGNTPPPIDGLVGRPTEGRRNVDTKIYISSSDVGTDSDCDCT